MSAAALPGVIAGCGACRRAWPGTVASCFRAVVGTAPEAAIRRSVRAGSGCAVPTAARSAAPAGEAVTASGRRADAMPCEGVDRVLPTSCRVTIGPAGLSGNAVSGVATFRAVAVAVGAGAGRDVWAEGVTATVGAGCGDVVSSSKGLGFGRARGAPGVSAVSFGTRPGWFGAGMPSTPGSLLGFAGPGVACKTAMSPGLVAAASGAPDRPACRAPGCAVASVRTAPGGSIAWPWLRSGTTRRDASRALVPRMTAGRECVLPPMATGPEPSGWSNVKAGGEVPSTGSPDADCGVTDAVGRGRAMSCVFIAMSRLLPEWRSDWPTELTNSLPDLPILCSIEENPTCPT